MLRMPARDKTWRAGTHFSDAAQGFVTLIFVVSPEGANRTRASNVRCDRVPPPVHRYRTAANQVLIASVN